MSGPAWLFGEEREGYVLDAAAAGELIDQGRRAALRLSSVPTSYVLDVLAKAGKAWSDPDSDLRNEAKERLSALLSFSPDMIDLCLRLIPALLDRRVLEERVALELGRADALDAWGPPRGSGRTRFAGRVRAFPLGLVVHVSAGNVFLGALDSLVMGLLTKNATLVKLASADPVFPLLFARTLAAADAEGAVAGALALVSWKGGLRAVEDVLKARADGVVVWGGAEAVAAWRSGLGEGTRLLEHGPRLSFAVVLRGAQGPREAAALARDVALWDQAACSSPQVAWVEGDLAAAQAFADLLAEELARQARELRPGQLGVHEQVELTKARELAAMAEALGEGYVRFPSDRAADWTVVVTGTPAPEPSPLNRCLLVKPVASADEVPLLVRPVASLLQTVGVAGPSERLARLATELGRAGVTRVTALGGMGAGLNGAPHDGRYGLEDLVRWADLEGLGGAGLLEELLGFARERSPFHGRRLAGLDLTSPRCLSEVPLTSSDDMVANVPPRGRDLLTGPEAGAHVFASGGSTGAPKYAFWAADEFDEVGRILARCFGAAGLRRDDRAANLFVAGNLWTSFLAVHKALEEVGCFSLPVGGTADMATSLRYVTDFRATVLLGIPSVLLELARLARAEGSAEALQVRLLLYAGEHLAEAAARQLSETFGGALVRSAGYASVDAGTIGYQCAAATGAWHHVLADRLHLEILDPETLAPVAPGAQGLLVATSLYRRLQPVIRVPTGDLGRWGTRSCPCGSPDPMFELLGRADDRVFVGGARFTVGDLIRVASAIPGLSSQVQVVVDVHDGRDRLTLRVEAEDEEAAASAAVGARLVDEFLRAVDDVRDAVADGWLRRPTVEVLPPGGLPRVRRTGKVVRVLDRRRA